MRVQVGDIVAAMDAWADPAWAESWDNVGLLCGDPEHLVTGVVTALDVTREAVEAAAASGAQMIVAHHPLLFRPLSSLAQGTRVTDTLALAQRYGVAVFAAHTNLDIAPGGVNDMLASRLQLTRLRGLHMTQRETLYKLAVYVPGTHADRIRSVLGAEDAGHIGKYSHCSFSVSGEGRFLPEENTHPYIGTAGQTETVAEERIETVVTGRRLDKTIAAMMAAHPYEEPAYDIYPLARPGRAVTLGKVGEWETPCTGTEALQRVKERLGIPVLRYAGDTQRTVRTVALCSGSGMEFYREALAAGADLYVTGDVRYHDAQDAEAEGLLVADGHHFHTEQMIAEGIADYLRDCAQRNGWQLDVEEDHTRRDVFSFL